MSIYLSYNEYTALGGTLDSAAFSRFEFAAEKYISGSTLGKSDNFDVYPDEIKKLVFELAEKLSRQDENRVQSETAGAWSRSFAAVSDSEAEAQKKKLLETYLFGVSNDSGQTLLYCGME